MGYAVFRWASSVSIGLCYPVQLKKKIQPKTDNTRLYASRSSSSPFLHHRFSSLDLELHNQYPTTSRFNRVTSDAN
ncbi:BnaUnng04150D [Brassica napus]|uniref:BnaUnng04150D protein n=1 Tax=Brassica napus TaxID=3708 RepID=A0A078JZM2_BRANA|nr:BnaUnng04150D [Brassica napus]